MSILSIDHPATRFRRPALFNSPGMPTSNDSVVLRVNPNSRLPRPDHWWPLQDGIYPLDVMTQIRATGPTDVRAPVGLPRDGGAGFETTSTDANVNLGDIDTFFPNAGSMTCVFWLRKTDTTRRNSTALAQSPTAGQFNVNVPWGDAIVYFSWGGTEVSISGLTFGDDCWIFSAGGTATGRGLEIWQNGQRVYNGAGVKPSRTLASGDTLRIGAYIPTRGDLSVIHDVMLYPFQLPMSLMAAFWDPATRWDLYPPPTTRTFFSFSPAGRRFILIPN